MINEYSSAKSCVLFKKSGFVFRGRSMNDSPVMSYMEELSTVASLGFRIDDDENEF